MSRQAWLLVWLVGAGALYLFSRTQMGQSALQSITDAGVNMIAKFEGFSATAYNDPPGSSKWSIGFGHQIQPGEDLLYRSISVDEGRAILAQDTRNAQSAVRNAIKVKLTPAQFDALTSFVFNIGPGAFMAGTVPAKINAGDFAGAAATMRKYVNSGGVYVQALADRRAIEASAFA